MTTLTNTASHNTASHNTASINCNMINRKAISGSTIGGNPVAAPARLVRHLARKWDLYGVTALMASCTAYGAFALAHVA